MFYELKRNDNHVKLETTSTYHAVKIRNNLRPYLLFLFYNYESAYTVFLLFTLSYL